VPGAKQFQLRSLPPPEISAAGDGDGQTVSCRVGLSDEGSAHDLHHKCRPAKVPLRRRAASRGPRRLTSTSVAICFTAGLRRHASNRPKFRDVRLEGQGGLRLAIGTMVCAAGE